MKNGKYSNKKGLNMKPLALLLALTLLLGCAIGGTIAWLTASTQKVENTFTVGNIDITLKEGNSDATTADVSKSFKMVPGHTIDKDPKVTVADGSEDCWLFVEIDESSNLLTYIDYDIVSGWTTVQEKNTDGVTVIGRKVMATETTKAFDIIGYTNSENKFVPNKVLVNNTVTKELMDDLNKTNAVQPTLTFKAYAVQLYKSNGEEFTAGAAWAIAKP